MRGKKGTVRPRKAMNSLRWGYSTGACAAAAAKAAVLRLLGQTGVKEVEIGLPGGDRVGFAVHPVEGDSAHVGVRKYAGDDPDITDGVEVIATASWVEGEEVCFAAGKGVGTVRKPGLSIPPGEAAINPVPREMIRSAVREVTKRGVMVTISIPNGEILAGKTFNPRLGIEGGLSILGTTGLVRPFSCKAIQCSIECALNVAAAADVTAPVLVPGHIGERSARRHLALSDEQVIEVGNEWGFTLDALRDRSFEGLLVFGHPGKLAKLAEGEWDTHSSRSNSAVPTVARLASEIFGTFSPETGTVEGIFAGLSKDACRVLAERLSEKIGEGVNEKLGGNAEVSVALINMKGDILGQWGGMGRWR